MIIAVNLPINDYLKLEDCPGCNKGKLVFQVNAHAKHCTMCQYSQATIEQATKPSMSFSERVQNVTRQQAIDKWMGMDK